MIKVSAKYIAISPIKVRLLTDLLKGKRAEDALDYLRFEPQKAKTPLSKLISSAISAAEEKKLDKDKLIIKEVLVNGGPIYKKQKVRARGRADLQKRRTSHITIVLSDTGNHKSKITKFKQISSKNKNSRK